MGGVSSWLRSPPQQGGVGFAATAKRITVDIGKNTADRFLPEILPSVGKALAMSGRIEETGFSLKLSQALANQFQRREEFTGPAQKPPAWPQR